MTEKEKCFTPIVRNILVYLSELVLNKVESIFREKAVKFWVEQKKEYFGW